MQESDANHKRTLCSDNRMSVVQTHLTKTEQSPSVASTRGVHCYLEVSLYAVKACMQLTGTSPGCKPLYGCVMLTFCLALQKRRLLIMVMLHVLITEGLN